MFNRVGPLRMTARHLTVVHYPPGQHWTCLEVVSPTWEAVTAAILKMDDNEYPIVQLSWKDVESGFDDEESFNIIGRRGPGFALFECDPGWEFDDPTGGEEEVRLWRSDQGHFCQKRNIVADVKDVLTLVRVYFETGSYDAVQQEVLASRGI
jgi:hypothetical protein